MKTQELASAALDYAVAIAEGMSFWTSNQTKWDTNDGYTDWVLDRDGRLRKYWFDGSRSRSGHWTEQDVWMPSTCWSQGGPLLGKGMLCLEYKHFPEGWECRNGVNAFARGHTALIAVCRCYVASELGDEVDIPEELLK